MTLERKLVLDPDESYCPVRATLALLGQKWVPHIIHDLMDGKRRFNELTPRGRELGEALAGLAAWGRAHLAEAPRLE